MARIRVRFNNSNHYVGVVDLTDTKATINVSSTPQQAVFYIGDSKKFDINDDGKYDIYVKLNDIKYSRASITVKLIDEEIQDSTIITGEENTEDDDYEEDKEINNNKKYFFITLILIILIIAGFYCYKYYKKKRYYHRGH
jgi:hypothetical protein